MLTHTEPKLNSKLYSYNPPTFPDIADLDYPAAIQKEIKAVNKAWEAWVQTDTDYLLAAEKLKQARHDFDAAIKHAADNSEPMPKIPDFEALDAQVKYQAQVALKARKAFDQAAGKFHTAIKAHKLDVLQLAIDKAEAGAEQFAATLERIQAELIQADEQRRRAYDGLAMMRNHVTDYTRYDADFSMADTWILPRRDEAKARHVIHLLTRYKELQTGNTTKTTQPSEAAEVTL